MRANEQQGDSAAAVSGDGEKAYQLFQQASQFLNDGHPGAAAQLLERALRLEPAKDSLREALGRAYFALHEYERAALEFAAIIDHVPVDDYAHYALGWTLLKLGHRSQARKHLRLALTLTPTSERYRLALRALEKR